MTTTARHQAEQMQALLTELETTERRLRVVLDTRATGFIDLCDRVRELNAHIRVHAETLARAVLAETAPRPAIRCGAVFAGHTCGLPVGHPETHHDSLTDLRWD